MISGVLCGVAGTYISTAASAGFVRDMTAGKGYLALAALIFGKWRPYPTLAACLLFAFADAGAARLQGVALPVVGRRAGAVHHRAPVHPDGAAPRRLCRRGHRAQGDRRPVLKGKIDHDLEERLVRHLGRTPETSAAIFIAPSATVVGDVRLGAGSSVFYGAVLRGDINEIRVGEGTNIQDNAVVHLADDLGAYIGAWCTVGHGAIVHACMIGDACLVGMGATVLDGAEIGSGSLVGANALVPQRFKCPPGSLVYGSPARVVRPLGDGEREGIRSLAEKYVEVARAHAARARAR